VQITYRARQFWYALTATPDPEDLDQARRVLLPSQMALFTRLQASEQAHSLEVFRRLRERNETNRDLLVAALLHDVGKSRHPIRLWERVAIVLGKVFFPKKVGVWGQGEPRGWRRPFVIAEQHAVWGAEMARRAGASPTTVALIQRHQEAHGELSARRGEAGGFEDELLRRLQYLDNES
jgi:putative nucleotidyltransferase with HDIG domain